MKMKLCRFDVELQPILVQAARVEVLRTPLYRGRCDVYINFILLKQIIVFSMYVDGHTALACHVLKHLTFHKG